MNDRDRWNQKYAAGEYSARPHPSAYLVENRAYLEQISSRNAADLACGRGRNSWYLASLGFAVDGFDVSSVGLSLASQAEYGYPDTVAPIRWYERDLLGEGLPCDARYDLIIMIRFVAMSLLEGIADHLNPGGVVVVEEHLIHSGSEEIVGPRSERFRVESGALKEAVRELSVIHEFEGLVQEPDGDQAAVARIIAQKSPH